MVSTRHTRFPSSTSSKQAPASRSKNNTNHHKIDLHLISTDLLRSLHKPLTNNINNTNETNNNISTPYIQQPNGTYKVSDIHVADSLVHSLNNNNTNKHINNTSDAISTVSNIIKPRSAKQLMASHNPPQAKKIDTAGDAWYNLPATPITNELKNDLTILYNRHVLQPNSFFKRDIRKSLPKYFHVGTVINQPHEYYTTRNQSKKSISYTEQLLHDEQTRHYLKRKMTEIQQKTTPTTIFRSKRGKKMK